MAREEEMRMVKLMRARSRKERRVKQMMRGRDRRLPNGCSQGRLPLSSTG